MKFPRFSWRAPAPRPAFVWRWVYPVVLIGFVAVAALVADTGLENALRIKDGKTTKVETDPAKPRWLAEVVPTPTLLVLETNANNEVVGVTAMSLGAEDKGGWVLQLPPETRTGDGRLLWQIWRETVFPAPASTTRPAGSTATTPATTALAPDSVVAGKAAMARAVGQLLGFAFVEDVVVLPTKTLASLMASAMPITYTLRDKVQVVLPNDALLQLFGPGVIHVQKSSEVVDLFEAVIPNESPQTRLKRQTDLWSAWIGALAAKPTAIDAIETDSATLLKYIKALVTGPSEYRQLPIDDEIRYQGLYVLQPDAARLMSISVQMVPFPLMVEPGSKLRTALFNGTADRDLTLAASTRLIEHGAQIDVLGNASSFDIARSEIVYYDAALQKRIEAFGRSLGIDAIRLLEGEAAVDVTVTLGADFKT